MENSTPLGVRKGAWTEEEDLLLRKCIEKNGEGKWHQVPHMSGLNRCRKSCRLRWLNYLRPNIKRGEFTSDEVDLIVKLHKLLGNRWSLIAGRLPERTANDVKNYWNTHHQKKLVGSKKLEGLTKTHKMITKANIIRPRPRTFTKKPILLMGNAFIQSEETLITKPSPTSSPDIGINHHGMPWWDNISMENLMHETSIISESEEKNQIYGTLSSHEESLFPYFQPTANIFDTAEEILVAETMAGDSMQSISVQESQQVFGDFTIDVDLWNFLGDQGIDSHLMG